MFKYFSVDHIKKTMNVINTECGFRFFVLPMRMEAPNNWINRTVSDKKGDSSTYYHLETLKFLVFFTQYSWQIGKILDYKGHFYLFKIHFLSKSIGSYPLWVLFEKNIYLLSFLCMVRLRCKMNWTIFSYLINSSLCFL